ncbi:MAG TPA: hypothetical protein PKA63_03700 [Oligoflexia bacterium]|nr:hypothetical protein [Oligoflexia bacterium]HMP47759.1 hypothetical protein [Oligoflexia bacterium]
MIWYGILPDTEVERNRPKIFSLYHTQPSYEHSVLSGRIRITKDFIRDRDEYNRRKLSSFEESFKKIREYEIQYGPAPTHPPQFEFVRFEIFRWCRNFYFYSIVVPLALVCVSIALIIVVFIKLAGFLNRLLYSTIFSIVFFVDPDIKLVNWLYYFSLIFIYVFWGVLYYRLRWKIVSFLLTKKLLLVPNHLMIKEQDNLALGYGSTLIMSIWFWPLLMILELMGTVRCFTIREIPRPKKLPGLRLIRFVFPLLLFPGVFCLLFALTYQILELQGSFHEPATGGYAWLKFYFTPVLYLIYPLSWFLEYSRGLVLSYTTIASKEWSLFVIFTLLYGLFTCFSYRKLRMKRMKYHDSSSRINDLLDSLIWPLIQLLKLLKEYFEYLFFPLVYLYIGVFFVVGALYSTGYY